jgi:hypothetical protein
METREYNELFIKMNIQIAKDKNLITGPKFFNIINEFDPTHEDYYQYMEDRKRRGLNTSRKIFSKEVLESLDDNTRQSVVNRINQIAEEFQSSKNEEEVQTPRGSIFNTSTSIGTMQNTQVEIVEENVVIDEKITDSEAVETEQEEKIIVETDFEQLDEPTILHLKTRNPKVFISYSWDDEAHKDWVLKFSADLRAKGIETILDRYFLRSGSNASVFMEKSIEQSDKVLIIFTEKYKEKASERKGGAGIEYSMMSIDLCRSIAGNTKYIPILRKGSIETSIPLFLRPYIASYMTNDEEYQEKLNELIHAIFDRSLISAPEIGEIPVHLRN